LKPVYPARNSLVNPFPFVVANVTPTLVRQAVGSLAKIDRFTGGPPESVRYGSSTRVMLVLDRAMSRVLPVMT